LIGEHYRLTEGLQVTADGTGIVSHAGVALIRALADNTGLTTRLSQALASRRLLVHDRGRVLADLACAIADGAEVISDFRVMGDQEELFGLVAAVPTAWRTLAEIAGGGERTLGKVTAAVNAARRRAWAAAAARHGAAWYPCRGQDAGRRDLHPAGRQPGDLPQRQGRGRAEFQGVRPAPADIVTAWDRVSALPQPP
jgi:hypothetical protein